MKKNNRFKLCFMQDRKGKIFFIFLTLLLVMFFVIACNNEIFKEEKSEKKIQQTVLVELYIAEGCPACAKLEPLLEQLADEYNREEMILVEAAPWGNYHTAEIRQRFDWYALTPVGVPQMMFNGLSDFNVGVLDESTIRNKIETQLAIEPVIKLQASRNSNVNSNIFTGTIKNIGSSTLINLVINGIVFADREKTGFRYSVVDIFEEEKVTINSLIPGQERDFTISIEELDWEGDNLDGVIFIQSVDHEKKVIGQSIFVD